MSDLAFERCHNAMLGAVETDDDQRGSQHDKDYRPRVYAHEDTTIVNAT
jgi:hypothetical protein